MDYGLDAPGVMRNYFIAGALLILGAIWFWPLAIPGAYCLLYGTAMLTYSRVGKFLHRDRMLSLVNFRGDETVLDIGTGRGLLMIGAAKKLKTGTAYGSDIWAASDLSGNHAMAVVQNIEAEGVSDRALVRTEDARKLSFKDNSVDVVLSLLCLHNIMEGGKFDAKGREKACREIVRILKPGGTAVISDGWHCKQYRQVFDDMGLKTEEIGPLYLRTFPALTIVKATKA